ncbi:unnamed protein product [Urochloa humidicola]
MMLLFDTKAQRDAVVNEHPIFHEGGRLTFERSEETSNHFGAIPEWLVAVSALDFPVAFRKLGTVVEVDPVCLNGDYSSMRVLVERLRPNPIPDDLWVGNPRGLGTTFRVSMLRDPWRREEQLDAQGNLRPFVPRTLLGRVETVCSSRRATWHLSQPMGLHLLAPLVARAYLPPSAGWADLLVAQDASRAMTPTSLATSTLTPCLASQPFPSSSPRFRSPPEPPSLHPPHPRSV